MAASVLDGVKSRLALAITGSRSTRALTAKSRSSNHGAPALARACRAATKRVIREPLAMGRCTRTQATEHPEIRAGLRGVVENIGDRPEHLGRRALVAHDEPSVRSRSRYSAGRSLPMLQERNEIANPDDGIHPGRKSLNRTNPRSAHCVAVRVGEHATRLRCVKLADQLSKAEVEPRGEATTGGRAHGAAL